MEKALKWLEVAKNLEKGEVDIACPFCNASLLDIKKAPWPNLKKQDVYATCPSCDESTVFGGVEFGNQQC